MTDLEERRYNKRMKADVIRIVERWENASFLYLAAGELTAEETRKVLAVVRAIKAELQHLL